MGKKYSINSAGRIVAERDIYSLGGFIPKGRLGGYIKDETQLSQEGECWLAGGNISTRPDVRIKDNAYIGDFFANEQAVHTDGVTEFSGNTLIPGHITIRSFAADTKNNVFVKDSFIGVSMDVLCGPSTTATAFPFEQGGFNKDVPKGTLFTSASMHTGDANICRTTANLRLGRDTYIYIPAGYNCRIFWAYWNTNNQLAYSGESFAVSQALTKLSHPVYKLAMVHISKADGTAMTPANLLATGAKILGHISGSLMQDLRPESASGGYVMVNSSFIAETNNFGLATTQLRFLAGGLYDTNLYTKTDRQDYKPYGTFRNVGRLEYTKYLSDSHRTAATRDTYISAYDCPLLRVDNTTYINPLDAKGNLVLRRCIVPKAEFQDDAINGNTYEDIDFSYTNEDLGFTMAGYTRFLSSHKQGIYRMSGGYSSTGFVSYKGNLADTARLYQAEKYIPLDGDIIEQGSYVGTADTYYEDSKNTAVNRVRTGKPLPTFGAVFPTAPSGFKVTFIVYLREDFKIRASQVNPTTIETANPYFVVVFGKADDSPVTPSEFIALNRTLRIIDHTKAPEITGSAYVGAGCTVRGDVQLHGDPYVNRVLDVNLWERGEMALEKGVYWEDAKADIRLHARFRLKQPIPVSNGDTFTAESGYNIWCVGLDEDKNVVADSGAWVQTDSVKSDRVKYEVIVVRKGADALIDYSDIPLANVKYLRAFKNRRYIVNELDRKSPEDILLGPDYWEQGTLAGGTGDAGKTYEGLKAASGTTIRPKRPIKAAPSTRISNASEFTRGYRVLDALTKFLAGDPITSKKMALFSIVVQKNPSAAITPSEIPNSRLVLEFVPQPMIVVPYGSATLFISGPKIRMYDNAVLSRNLNQEGEIVLSGDAVMGYGFNSGSCMCSNGHSDAIIKLP